MIQNSKAINNPGDPSNLSSHSGNGIVVSSCRSVVIQSCIATANGWDMPRKGNGPVGIWAFEADSILIQQCISYKNRTSKGGEDGGGFDLDGGVTNSVIQYCLSYGNEGSGFGIFQYAGASPWYNNTIRFNISENDGNVSAAKAAVYIWNGPKNKNEFSRCYFYNNTIYNGKGSAISYAPDSENDSFYFYNNISVSGKDLIIGKIYDGHFLGNNWWNLGGTFSSNGAHSFISWARKYNFEIEEGRVVGFNINPHFKRPGSNTQKSTEKIRHMKFYQLPAGSILKHGGMNLNKRGVQQPEYDFNKIFFSKGLIGACS
ncbi:MAG: hypothetical protein NVSMB67_12980 [Flavisolibacter sp.]